MNKPNSNIWGKEDFRANHHGCGIYSIKTARHGGIAIAKDSIQKLEFLKPLSNLNLGIFSVEDDTSHLYFEQDQYVSILLSLFPTPVVQQVCNTRTYELAEVLVIQAQSAVKNTMPIIYELLHGTKLSPSQSKAVAEAEFYRSNQSKYVIKAEFAPASNEELVIVRAQKICNAEIYGVPVATDKFQLPLSEFERLVKLKVMIEFYPTNNQPQNMVDDSVIDSISAFKMAS